MAGLIALMGLLPLLGEASARQDVRATRRWTPAISEPGVSALYTTATNAPGIAVCEIGDVRAEYQWDRFGARLTNLVWKVNDTAIASFAQTYPTNDIHRIERRERLDGSHWDYLYDGVGRLTNAVLRLADGNVAPGGRYAYEWDDAGNPVRGGPVDGDEPRWSFEHNTGNLQVRRVWGNQVEILGEAAADATVGVSLDGGAFSMVERRDERYRFLGAVPGLAASAMDLAVEIVAVRQEGPNEIVQRTRGRLYLPKADETAEIDTAGQLSETSRWEYTWNLRGQLIRAESRHRSPNVRLDYDYYPSGPMARRICSEWANGAWAAAGTNQWIVDGWRPVKEIERTASATMVRRYIWGLDLAGVRDHASMDAAGGIGGLLAVCEREGEGPETVRHVISDPQGNVMALADAAGTLVARYDYDPFGRLIMETGEASTCPFRYSTKYRDPDLELYYYGHRWYDPAAMKWLTPDPIGERGGVNLTAFCRNDPINNTDPLGLEIKDYEDDPWILGLLPSPPSSVPLGVKYKYGTTWWEDAWAQTANIGHVVNNAFSGILYQLHPDSPLQRAVNDPNSPLGPVAFCAPAAAPVIPAVQAVMQGAPLLTMSAASEKALETGFITWMRSAMPQWMLRAGTAIGAGMGLQTIKAPEAPVQVNAPIPPSTPRQTTVLGEEMKERVIPYAREIGARPLPWAGTPEQWRAWSAQQRYRANDRMLRIRAREGDFFITIGTDPRRPEALRREFDLTRAELLRLYYMRIPVEERSPVNVYEVLGDPIEVLGRMPGE